MVNNLHLKFDAIIETPFSRLGLLFQESLLCTVEYLKSDIELKASNHPDTLTVIEQIEHYSKNAQYCFDIKLSAKGTAFQQRVWQEMCRIPAGQVKTYGEVAAILSSSPRAVGNACRANPIPLIIPCHRIVSAAGIGGFAGATSGYFTDIKRQLLRHEGLEF